MSTNTAALNAPSIAPLAQRFIAVRQATEKLVAHLSEADCVVQSMPDASPVKWHLAHTTWFFETFVLERATGAYVPVHPAYRVLFNSYYNGVGDKYPRPERGLITRPDLAQVRAYRQQIDARMHALLQAQATIDPALLAVIEIGLNHEQQHQELILTDFKHLLSKNPLFPAYQEGWPLMPVAQARPEWLSFAGGLVEIGHEGAGYAFDNESPRHRVWLDPFELAACPVTNGEYLAFINDGGYRRPELWLSLGWDAVTARGWQAPMYWLPAEPGREAGPSGRGRETGWNVFTLRGLTNLDPWAPVCHLSYFEADAYARWAGARLPTEAQWEHVATQSLSQLEEANLAGTGIFHPAAQRFERAPGQPAQLFGDVWEWTRSSYEAYPGFEPAPGMVGEYNGKFMCGQYVLRGGSCATPTGHVRATYRNFFPPDARWQFSGLRLVR